MTADRHVIWTRPALLAQVLAPRRDGLAMLALGVPSLDTGWQALRLEQHLAALAGVNRVEVDTSSRRIRLCLDPARTDLPRILHACERAGCAATPLARDTLDDADRRAADDALKRLLVGGICAMQAMMFALVLYLDLAEAVDATTVQLFRWLEMLAATPAIFYAGAPFFRHALRDLRAKRAGIDVPIALAVALIYLASTVNTLRGHGHIWFDSAAMLIFALLLGRYLELRARHRQQARVRAAEQAVPLAVTRCLAAGRRETVAVAELEPGDRIHVGEGAVVPVDGVLQSVRARLDTSLHSGESRPQTCLRGEAIAAGSVVLDGSLELEVTRTGAATSLARLQQLTRTARLRRSGTEAGPSGAVSAFIFGTVTLAALTLAFWLWRDPARAFDACVAVLVVSCPCAFALAAPATLTRAMTLLTRAGVRVIRPRALYALARVDRAVFDKTGTLTHPGIADFLPQPHASFGADDTLAAAVALARESRHPLARALARAHAGLDVPPVEEVRVESSRGISGTIAGRRLHLGRPRTTPCDDGESLWLEDANTVLARFTVHETLRSGVAHLLHALAADGMVPILASGDAPARVQALAGRLAIADWRARQSPTDKHAAIAALQREDHTVLMVGDGSNDAAALAAADVSASLVDATDLARQQADLLIEGRLDGLMLARRTARHAMRTLRWNRRWGLCWNLLAIPFAAAGLVPPWLAALGMSVSSLVVVLNVLRMQLPGEPAPAAQQPLRERLA